MLSIIIINFKNPPLLRLCLKTLKNNLVEDFYHEIIVVDSASSPETRNVVKEFPDTILWAFDGNIGYTRGVNEGIKAASGDYFLILNPDIIPIKGAIENIYNYMTKNKDVGLAGPKLLNFDGTAQNSCFRFYTPLTMLCRRTFLGLVPPGKKYLEHFLMNDSDLSKPAKVDWLMGSAIMASRAAVDDVGLMDGDLFLYMTDVDWARRFWENGYKVIYYPYSEMYHYHKRGSKGRFILTDIFLRKETRWHLMDALRYFKKHGLSVPNLSA